MDKNDKIQAKPFLKWAGGKTQLINEIEKNLPKEISKNKYTYIEPFVGSGAVMFWILDKYPTITNAIINDINKDLTDCYISIKTEVNNLIDVLDNWEKEYHNLTDSKDIRKEYYYEKRSLFNSRKSTQLVQSSLFIFLNRTCFNGLYRVNRKNEFNVPVGSYKKPQICNKKNLIVVSALLQRVTILNGDYTDTIKYTNNNTLFYFDPPYKPLSETSSFNSYAKDGFDDKEQIRLKKFCDTLDGENHQWILSNSDVNGKNYTNTFFDKLFNKFNITRVLANRIINPHQVKNYKISELIISNI